MLPTDRAVVVVVVVVVAVSFHGYFSCLSNVDDSGQPISVLYVFRRRRRRRQCAVNQAVVVAATVAATTVTHYVSNIIRLQKPPLLP